MVERAEREDAERLLRPREHRGDGAHRPVASAGDYGALTVTFDITDSGGASISWVAYASSTDNITGDGWVSIASADLTPDDLTIIGLGTK